MGFSLVLPKDETTKKHEIEKEKFLCKSCNEGFQFGLRGSLRVEFYCSRMDSQSDFQVNQTDFSKKHFTTNHTENGKPRKLVHSALNFTRRKFFPLKV